MLMLIRDLEDGEDTETISWFCCDCAEKAGHAAARAGIAPKEPPLMKRSCLYCQKMTYAEEQICPDCDVDDLVAALIKGRDGPYLDAEFHD